MSNRPDSVVSSMQKSPAVSRRVVLGAAMAGGVVVAACTDTSGGDDAVGPAGPTRHRYGDDPAQVADLYLPDGPAAAGVIVIIHGGFWRAQYDLTLGAPLAADLARRGWAGWNLEYRRVGNGGGWPATLDDVAAGIDHLATLDVGLDLSSVVTIGHSAGGQLAAWAAARPGRPADAPGASPGVAVTAVIAQAGVLDLRAGVDAGLGNGAIGDFLGGSPDEVPDRYDAASPIERVPLGVPVRCVHGRGDDIVPVDQSERYVAAATAAGDDAVLVEVDGDHFAVIDVTSQAWATTVELVGQLA